MATPMRTAFRGLSRLAPKSVLLLFVLAGAVIPVPGAAQSAVMPVFPGGGGAAGGQGQPSVVATLGEPIAGWAGGASQPSTHTGFLSWLTASMMSGEVPPVVANAAHPATVTVTLAGFHAVPTVVLHFRMGGAQSFATVSMTRNGETPTWTGLIPAAHVGVRGLQFYIEVDDGIGTLQLPVGSPAVLNNIQVNLADQPLFSTSDRYAMRGIGMVATDPEPAAVFSDLGSYDITRWRYATYNPAGGGAYVEPPSAAPAVPGRGFWIISRTAHQIRASGHSTRLDQAVTVTLSEGWNLIANPFAFAVAVADLSLPAGADANLIGWQDGGYVNFSETLEPGLGYWVYYEGTAPASLLIPPLGSSGKGVQPALPLPFLADDGPGWGVLVSAQAGAFTDTDHRFGLALGATSGRDAFDFMAAPLPMADYVALSFLADCGARLLYDFRSADSEGECWLLAFETDQVQTPFRVSFQVERALPSGWRLLAIDPSTLQEIDLVASGEIVGRSGTAGAHQRWHLAAGPEAFLDKVRNDALQEFNQAIVAFALHPSYPNPFTAGSGSVITLAAPRRERATVRVYDLRGRLVKTLHDGPVERGLTRLSWHGEDNANQRVAAGVYLVRMRAADTDLVQRVLLVR